MKKFLVSFLIFFICSGVSASDFKNLPYKNIKDGTKISVTQTGSWLSKVKRNDINIYFKDGTNFRNSNNSQSFETGCKYMFLYQNRLIGYSDTTVKFYEFNHNNGNIVKQELSFDEVARIFSNFRIIATSEFSKTTNVYKMKMKRGEEKILILNDTETFLENYEFTTNNSEIEKYEINNAVLIKKNGMIQFAKNSQVRDNSPWFIILVR